MFPFSLRWAKEKCLVPPAVAGKIEPGWGNGANSGKHASRLGHMLSRGTTLKSFLWMIRKESEKQLEIDC